MKLEPKKKKYLLLALAVLVIAAVAGGFLYPRYAAKKKQTKQAETKAPDRIYTAKKGDLILGVMLTGSVNAKTKYKLAMEAPWGTKLIKVVDENKEVKAGEIVAEYETYDLLLKIDDLKVNLDNRRKDLEIALDELAILVSTNEADIRTARDSVTDAEDAYSKYWRLEGPRDRDEQQLTVDEAKKALDDAESELTTLQDEVSMTVYADAAAEEKAQKDIETAEQKRDSAKTKYNSAILVRKIFKRYTQPNKLKELRNKLAQAQLNLKKTKVRTEASLAQKKKQIFQHETQIRKYERDLKKHQSYVPMMTLRAPVTGIVMYGDPDRRWGNPEVKVGMDARRKQVIITIPDMSKMIVDVNLPEQYRSKVSVGDEVIITPDSIQTIKMKGRIARIAQLPVNLIPWDQNSPKIYQTIVDFSGNDSRIVSGMSVQVEVISRILHDVLFIPIEAVFEENGKLLVYRKAVAGPEKVFVKIGASNNNFVEITEGLSEGDDVYLYRPFQAGSKL